MKGLIAVALLLAASLPAYAQSNTSPNLTPTTPNSGAGVQGMPGSKSGPTVRSDQSTAPSQTGTAGQDAAKVPGMPGGKSGPAAKSPNPK